MTVCSVRSESRPGQSSRRDPHLPGFNAKSDFRQLCARQSVLPVTQLVELQSRLLGPGGLFAKLSRQIRGQGRQASLLQDLAKLQGRERQAMAEQAVQFVLGVHGQRSPTGNPFRNMSRESLCYAVFNDNLSYTAVERYAAGEALRARDSEYFIKLIATTRDTVERRIVFHGLLEHFDGLLPIEKSIYPLNYRTVQQAHLDQEEALYGKLTLGEPVSSILEKHTPEWLLNNLHTFQRPVD
jgi:hypothetical protein